MTWNENAETWRRYSCLRTDWKCNFYEFRWSTGLKKVHWPHVAAGLQFTLPLAKTTCTRCWFLDFFFFSVWNGSDWKATPCSRYKYAAAHGKGINARVQQQQLARIHTGAAQPPTWPESEQFGQNDLWPPATPAAAVICLQLDAVEMSTRSFTLTPLSRTN